MEQTHQAGGTRTMLSRQLSIPLRLPPRCVMRRGEERREGGELGRYDEMMGRGGDKEERGQ